MPPFEELSTSQEQSDFRNNQLIKNKVEKETTEVTTQPTSADDKNPQSGTIRPGEGYWISVIGTPPVIKMNIRLQSGDVYSVAMTKEP